MTPAVSILLPSYNYARFLRAAVESVLAQTCSDWELVLVDDGSQDGSPGLADAYARHDARIRFLQHPGGGNRGLAATLRLGLRQCRAPLVAFLEADDQWRPEALAARLAMLEAHPDAALCFNLPKLLVEDRDDTEYYRYILRCLEQVAQRRRPPRLAFREVFAVNLIPSFSCVMARRDALAGCSFASPDPALLDKWLWQQLFLKGECLLLPESLTLWRLHANSYICRTMSRRHAFAAAFRREACALLAERTGKAAGKEICIALRHPAAYVIACRLLLKYRADGMIGLLRAFLRGIRVVTRVSDHVPKENSDSRQTK